MACKYVKDFSFDSNQGYTGSAGKGYARGGKVLEKATGETYPSRKAMVKHEKTETPRMQREELVQKQVVRGPAMAAGRDPRIPMLKCGGSYKK